jgi:hypothetical protein
MPPRPAAHRPAEPRWCRTQREHELARAHWSRPGRSAPSRATIPRQGGPRATVPRLGGPRRPARSPFRRSGHGRCPATTEYRHGYPHLVIAWLLRAGTTRIQPFIRTHSSAPGRRSPSGRRARTVCPNTPWAAKGFSTIFWSVPGQACSKRWETGWAPSGRFHPEPVARTTGAPRCRGDRRRGWRPLAHPADGRLRASGAGVGFLAGRTAPEEFCGWVELLSPGSRCGPVPAARGVTGERETSQVRWGVGGRTVTTEGGHVLLRAALHQGKGTPEGDARMLCRSRRATTTHDAKAGRGRFI